MIPRKKSDTLYSALVAAISAAYWLLFAYANSMIIHYDTSIYPLLNSTGTPNPYFFLKTGSFFAFYNSGLEWAPSSNFMFMLLVGDTLFSIVITSLVAWNVTFALRLSKQGAFSSERSRYVAFIFLSIAIVAFAMPLMALPLLFIPSNQSTIPLQVWAINYAPESNAATVLVLLLLVPAWNRLSEWLNGNDVPIGAAD